MKDVMIDLETLGTKPGCTILSIGAVAFDPEEGHMGETFYAVVNRKSCMTAGLTEDQSTLDWWAKQSPEACKVLTEAEGGLKLKNALNSLTEYLKNFGLNRVCVWGNGSDFDNATLAVCYDAIGQDLPWKFWNNRCYRTLKGIVKGPKLTRQGTYHNALDDAISQAEHAVLLLHNLQSDLHLVNDAKVPVNKKGFPSPKRK